MTRKEAKVAFIEELKYILNTKSVSKEVNFKFIDRIFNDHEEQLKAKDEELNRMKELQQPKSCEGCTYEKDDAYCDFMGCARNVIDRFKLRD